MISSKIPKIICDTNLFISIFVFQSFTIKILDLCTDGRLDLCMSDDLEYEIKEKLLNKFNATNQTINDLEKYLSIATWFETESMYDICRDSEDNFLLDLANVCKANFLITRDKDLLELPYEFEPQTKRITPEDFFQLLRDYSYD